MVRCVAAALSALALLPAAGFACAIGRDPAAIKGPATAYDTAEGALPIVATGTNAPEALLHVYAVKPVHNGLETVYAFAGPCRAQSFRKTYLTVRTSQALEPGDLFFHVNRTGVPDGRWALRRATPSEEHKFQVCRWS